jgi:hypothetical protein
MSYTSVDAGIRDWCETRRLKLFTRFAGEEHRFCYTSSDAGECFQISIEPPIGSEIIVNAWSVETNNDDELHESWQVATPDLRRGLDLALARVEEWKARPAGAR